MAVVDRPEADSLVLEPTSPFEFAESLAFVRGFVPCAGDHPCTNQSLTTGGYADGVPFVAQITEGDDGSLSVAVDWVEDPGDLDEAVRAETESGSLDPHTPVAVAILLGVIAIAALGLFPIVIAALGGVVAMIATGCLRPSEAYEAVSWNVVFLLAGVLPLGLAMQNTGGDALLAGVLVASTAVLPLVGVLTLVYLLTSLLANLITPVATVVLMIPVAVDTAARIGATPLTFLLAVMFAASTAFMTPIGYQTNLMVYGPGGYRFTDYIRVGAPLQALVTVVTTVGLVVFWGV